MYKLPRRQFLCGTALTGAGMVARVSSARPRCGARTAVVAAIQYAPVLGDVDSNISRAESFVRDAVRSDAEWIVLPEFFTSGLAVHPLMFDAVRPIDGAPTRFLKQTAAAHGVYIGGSFLASSEGDVFNTFVLATPSGEIFTHDKDFPSTIVESSFYAGGDDEAYVEKLRELGFDTNTEVIPPRKDNCADGVMFVNGRRVGVALCWELVRYRTIRRLKRGNVEMLLGASGWWWSSPEFGWPGRTLEAVGTDRKEQLALIREAPRRQARMLGVPVVHANFVGVNPGLESTEFDNPATGRYLGQSQIVDRTGKSIILLDEKEEGVAVAEVETGPVDACEAIPEQEFWMPEVNDRARKIWSSTGAEGRDYYLAETRKRVRDVTKR